MKSLLGYALGAGGRAGSAFEHGMECSCEPFLLCGLINALGHTAQPHPPDGECRQAPEPGSAKRRPVVTANPIASYAAKRPLEPRPSYRQRSRQRIAPQYTYRLNRHRGA